MNYLWLIVGVNKVGCVWNYNVIGTDKWKLVGSKSTRGFMNRVMFRIRHISTSVPSNIYSATRARFYTFGYGSFPSGI